MRSLRRPSLATFAVLLSTLTACSSPGADPEDGGDDAAPTDASVDIGVIILRDTGVDAPADVRDAARDAPDASDAGAGTDSGDAETSDASDGGDGGPAPAGSPCSLPNAVEQQTCGICGFQKRGCLASDGGFVWGEWGFCQNQVVNGCDPNVAYPSSACGNCGTRKTVCLSNCQFDVTQACNEPPNACKPGFREFVSGLSCDGGGRERTCDAQCTFGGFGSCQAGPTLPVLTLSTTVGATTSHVVSLLPQQTMARLQLGTCPLASSPSTVTDYAYSIVTNPDPAKTATVAIYHSTPLNAVYVDTIMALYPGTVPPLDYDVSARQKCLTGTSSTDGCTPSFSGLSPAPNPTACVSSNAGLRNVVVPPLGSVVVYTTAYFSGKDGDVQINAYTQSLQ